VIIKIIEISLSPLFQRGDKYSLWKREVRRDFMTDITSPMVTALH
jgi:hypothetical protein